MSAMIQVAALHGVTARPGDPGETGVWVGDRKIGAIGVRISSGFTWHGLAFNIDPDLGYFEHIVPCGIADYPVTSAQALQKPVDHATFDASLAFTGRPFLESLSCPREIEA